MCGLADNRTTKYNKEMRKNRIRILSMVVFSLCLPFSLFAQIDKDMKEFDDFVKQQHKEFDDFVSEQNKEFAEFLKEEGCDEIQGFLYYRPMCEEDFEKLFHTPTA